MNSVYFSGPNFVEMADTFDYDGYEYVDIDVVPVFEDYLVSKNDFSKEMINSFEEELEKINGVSFVNLEWLTV